MKKTDRELIPVVFAMSFTVALTIIDREPYHPIMVGVVLQVMALTSLLFWRMVFTTHGATVVLCGGFLNLLVIAANGGYMPVAGWEGFVTGGGSSPNHTTMIGAQLPWLGDWIQVGAGWMSPGDALVFSGIGTVVVEMVRKIRRRSISEPKQEQIEQGGELCTRS